MQRTPLNGRTFEYFGEDPYLAAQMAVGWTRGLQGEGVIGNVKHYAVNNQEGPGAYVPFSPVGVATARLAADRRRAPRRAHAARDLPAAVRGRGQARRRGLGDVRLSRASTGRTPARTSTCSRTSSRGTGGSRASCSPTTAPRKNTAPSLRNGLDLDIWPAQAYRPELVRLALAYRAGERAGGRRARAAHAAHALRLRLLRSRRLPERLVADRPRPPPRRGGGARGGGHGHARRTTGAILPLDAASTRKLALIGPEATVLQERRRLVERSARWPRRRRGRASRPGSAPTASSSTTARIPAARPRSPASADVAVVVVGDRMSEGADKPCMGLNCGTRRRHRPRRAHRGGGRRRSATRSSCCRTAAPSSRRGATGSAACSPPGTPARTAARRSPACCSATSSPAGACPRRSRCARPTSRRAATRGGTPASPSASHYKEGVLIGYRWFDERGLGVAYPFGHGLTYTTLRAEPPAHPRRRRLVARAQHRQALGHRVPQLYLGLPEPRAGVVQPPRLLKGFARVTLAPGAARRVSFRSASATSSTGTRRRTAGARRAGLLPRDGRPLLAGPAARRRDLPGRRALPAGSSGCRGRRRCLSRRDFRIRLRDPRGPSGCARRGSRSTGRRVKVVRRRDASSPA